MTSQQIKDAIDLQITDVTTVGGVSNVNEGERMKDILTYTDDKFDTTVAANTTGVSTNASGVSTNASGIASNVSNIDSNQSDIATNATDIATNVTNIGLCTRDADTDVSGNDWVLDEDDMSSDSATKVPTQQSVKAYVLANGGSSTLGEAIASGNTYEPNDDDTWTWGVDNVSYLDTDEDKGFLLENNLLSFTDGSGDSTGKSYIGEIAIAVGNGTHRGGIRSTNITGNRAFQLPDTSGTFELTRNIPLEYSATIQQVSTTNVFNTVSYDTISGGDFDTDPTNFRDFTYARTGTGTFTLELRYTSSNYPTPSSKIGIQFGDNSVRIGSRSTGGTGSHNFYKWTFTTYNTSGTLADDQLIGTQGASLNIKLYP